MSSLPPELVTLLIGALPVAELRGAIPAGIAMGLTFPQAFFWSCLGNLIPVIPRLFFLKPGAAWVRRFPVWNGFFEWFFEHAARKGQIIQRYEALGLAIFVLVPLPGTGAWTGCAAAVLFKLPFRSAFPAIAAGVLGAGGLVLLAVQMGLTLFYKSP